MTKFESTWRPPISLITFAIMVMICFHLQWPVHDHCSFLYSVKYTMLNKHIHPGLYNFINELINNRGSGNYVYHHVNTVHITSNTNRISSAIFWTVFTLRYVNGNNFSLTAWPNSTLAEGIYICRIGDFWMRNVNNLYSPSRITLCGV